MSILEKMKSPGFWKKTVMIAIPFFIAVVIVSLILSDAKSFFTFDFQTISELNFSNGKWKRFFGIKIIISVLYAIWMVSKKIKKNK